MVRDATRSRRGSTAVKPRRKTAKRPTARVPDELARAQRFLPYFQALAEAAKALTSTLELEQVLQVIMRSISALLAPENWSLMLLDPEKQELYFEIVVGEAADTIRPMRLPLGEGIAGWVAQHRKPLLVARVEDDPRFSRRMDSASAFHTSSIVCVPLVYATELLGVIELVSHEGARVFTEEELAALEPFADFAAIAIANARNFRRVQELTLVDEWTTLYNARFLQQHLGEEVQRAYRYHHPISIAFLDLDHFKNVNDTYGHDAGSRLLKEVGDMLWRALRVADRPVRYGGDEFVLVMPETPKPGGLVLAQRICDAIAAREFPMSGEGVARLTVSIGVATFPDDAHDPATLLAAADRAMYLAKAHGRNRVVDAQVLCPAVVE